MNEQAVEDLDADAPRLSRAELRPGDVILHHDGSLTARLIRLLDGTLVHHASLALSRDRVAESFVKTGAVDREIDESHRGRDWVLVRRFPAAEETGLDAVVACARRLVAEGHRYAYEQIPFLALLCLSRQAPRTRSFVPMAVRLLDTAVSELGGWVAHANPSSTPMVCSSFVYHCFWRAEPPGSFGLRVRTQGPGLEGLGSRGIDPESILANLPRVLPESPVTQEPAVSSLESLIEAYLDEAAAGSPAVLGLESFVTADLGAAVLRFARGLHRAVISGPFPEPIGAAQVLALLERVAGELVTPGDLLNTSSLRTRGRFDLEPGR